MFAVNTLAPMRLTRAFAPAMAQRGRGTIVTVGSLAGTFASAGSAPYASSKWGVRGWALSTYEVGRGRGRGRTAWAAAAKAHAAALCAGGVQLQCMRQ